jgi:ribosome recycling factor
MAYSSEEVEILFMDFEECTAKTVDSYKNELLSIRAGRANQHILDKVLVDYYGVATPIHQMANITVSEARILVISVWDKSALKDVEKAILAANVGITPNNDGTCIRLIFPELTADRRKAIAKDIKNSGENTKIILRNQRRDINEGLKALKKDNILTEDGLKTYLEEVDKKLASIIENIDKMMKAKEEEVLNV